VVIVVGFDGNGLVDTSETNAFFGASDVTETKESLEIEDMWETSCDLEGLIVTLIVVVTARTSENGGVLVDLGRLIRGVSF
jgi:hypothetical protein